MASSGNKSMQESQYLFPKILIVEDCTTQQLALNSQLEEAGYRTACAKNGREALALVKSTNGICLVISDWLMPEVDGYELLVRIRNNPDFHDIPFLMVTSKDSNEDAILALRTGANDFIRKPYYPEELLARVKNLVMIWYLRKQLEKEISHDELTGLYNSRSCRTLLQTEINRIKRYGGELSLIVFAINDFNKISEGSGQRAANLILENLGVLVRGNIRAVDYPCRSGNAEIAIILPCTDQNGAAVVADRLEKKIASQSFGKDKNKTLRVTCSFGVAELTAETDTLESFMARARTAVGQAKTHTK